MVKKFDVIVIGAGPSGSTAAYTLAKKGFDVLLLERGRVPGSKNMFGGKVYVSPLKEIYDDFEKYAPIHRWVTCEKISLFSKEDYISIEYKGAKSVSFTTFLTQLSNWMARRAQDEGATLLTEITVDGIYLEDGVAKGVIATGNRVEADVVIDAEGINRLILESAGIVKKPSPSQVALGIKEVIKLSTESINEEFCLNDDEGLAWIMIGDVTGNIPGGAFLYTQKEAISLGLVLILDVAIRAINEHVSRYVERLRTHRLLRRLFEKGTIVEYSAHLIPEDIVRLKPPSYYYDGLLITGDAAGFLLNLGYTYRGVDYAAYSGYLAGLTYEKAHAEGRFDKSTLSYYGKLLYDSFIMRNLKKFKDVHVLMRNPRIFREYPQLFTEFARTIFKAEYDSEKIMSAFSNAKKGKVSWFSLIKDFISLIRRL